MPRKTHDKSFVVLGDTGQLVARFFRQLFSHSQPINDSGISLTTRHLWDEQRTSGSKHVRLELIDPVHPNREILSPRISASPLEKGRSSRISDQVKSDAQWFNSFSVDACITDQGSRNNTVEKNLQNTLLRIKWKPNAVASEGNQPAFPVEKSISENNNWRFNPPPFTEELKGLIIRRLQKNQHRREAFAPTCDKVWVTADGETRIQFSPRESGCRLFRVPLETTFIQVFGKDQEGELLLGAFAMPELNDGEYNGGCDLFASDHEGQTINFAIWPRVSKRGKIKGFMAHLAYCAPDLEITAAEYCPFTRSLRLGNEGSLPSPIGVGVRTSYCQDKDKALRRTGFANHLISHLRSHFETRSSFSGDAQKQGSHVIKGRAKHLGPASVSAAAFVGTWAGIVFFTRWSGLAFTLVLFLARRAHKRAADNPETVGGYGLSLATISATLLSGAILLGQVVPQVPQAIRERQRTQIERTRYAMRKLADRLEQYKEETGSYPKKVSALDKESRSSVAPVTDAWNKKLQYQTIFGDIATAGTGPEVDLVQCHDFELRSAGPDSVWETKDDIVLRDGIFVEQS